MLFPLWGLTYEQFWTCSLLCSQNHMAQSTYCLLALPSCLLPSSDSQHLSWLWVLLDNCFTSCLVYLCCLLGRGQPPEHRVEFIKFYSAVSRYSLLGIYSHFTLPAGRPADNHLCQKGLLDGGGSCTKGRRREKCGLALPCSAPESLPAGQASTVLCLQTWV